MIGSRRAAWRAGQTDIAIGVAGLRPVPRRNGGRVAVADELAATAELVIGKLNRAPVAVIRGVTELSGDGCASELVRPSDRDLFR